MINSVILADSFSFMWINVIFAIILFCFILKEVAQESLVSVGITERADS